MVETLTEELIRMDLATLSHGGEEAITLFLEMSKRLHKNDADSGLHHWVTVAAPALPERERNQVLVLLLSSYLQSTRDHLVSTRSPYRLDA
jgi:hypothetical protein